MLSNLVFNSVTVNTSKLSNNYKKLVYTFTCKYTKTVYKMYSTKQLNLTVNSIYKVSLNKNSTTIKSIVKQ